MINLEPDSDWTAHVNKRYLQSLADETPEHCPLCETTKNFKLYSTGNSIGSTDFLYCVDCSWEKNVTNYGLW